MDNSHLLNYLQTLKGTQPYPTENQQPNTPWTVQDDMQGLETPVFDPVSLLSGNLAFGLGGIGRRLAGDTALDVALSTLDPESDLAQILYHGSHRKLAQQIIKDKALKSVSQRKAQQTSGGYTTEHGLIWYSPDKKTAAQYGMGWEAHGDDIKPGAVFETEDIDLDKFKIVDRHKVLDDKEAAILSQLNPSQHYKPIKAGETTLGKAVDWILPNKEVFNYKNILQMLGYDGMRMGEKQIAFRDDVKIPLARKATKLTEQTLGTLFQKETK